MRTKNEDGEQIWYLRERYQKRKTRFTRHQQRFLLCPDERANFARLSWLGPHPPMCVAQWRLP